MTNDDIIEKAHEIAQAKGGYWEDHILEARKAIMSAPPVLQKLVKKVPNNYDRLQAEAVRAQLRHTPTIDGQGMGDPRPDGDRVEIGEVETGLGRVRASISRDSVSIHGAGADLSDISPDLRRALVWCAAAFSKAQDAAEQTTQRAVIGAVVDAVMRRHPWLSAKVKEMKRRELAA
jgi:hypothetical protein